MPKIRLFRFGSEDPVSLPHLFQKHVWFNAQRRSYLGDILR
jgi:hypothetical protein